MRRIAPLVGLVLVVAPLLASATAGALGGGQSAGTPGRPACVSALDCDEPLAVPSLHRQRWVEAGEIYQLKLRFVDAVRLFAQAQAGTFGDEGPALLAAVDDMRASLTAWDDRVERFAAAVRSERDAEPHLALASVYLDRLRVEEAIRELTSADARQAGRSDVHAMLALAYGLANRPADALRALRTVASLDGDNPQPSYLTAQLARALQRPDDVLKALREFTRAVGRAGTAGATARPGRFDRIDLLRPVAGVEPIFPQQRYAAGFTRLDAGDYDAAVREFARAASTDPLLRDDSEAARDVRAAAAALRRGDVSGVTMLERLAAEGRDASEVHRVLGSAAWVAGDTNRSIEALRVSIRLQPDDERARLLLVSVLDAAGRPSEVERELQLMAELFPDSGKVRYLRAQLEEKQSRLTDAARSLEASAMRPPIVGRDAVLARLGAVLTKGADLDAAIDAYARRIAINPNSAEAHRQLAEVLFLRGRDEEALAEFTAAAWVEPDDARACAGIGQVYLRMERFGAAAGALQRALALGDGRKETRYALAIALARDGRADEGRREMERFQQAQAEENTAGQRQFEIEAMRRAGMQHLREGQPAVAVDVLTEALSRDSRHANLRRDLGVALLRADRVADAIEQLRAAQQLEPTEEGDRLLADAYRAAGDAEASREHLLARERAARTRRLAKLRDIDLAP